jgi:hypothetical protein
VHRAIKLCALRVLSGSWLSHASSLNWHATLTNSSDHSISAGLEFFDCGDEISNLSSPSQSRALFSLSLSFLKLIEYIVEVTLLIRDINFN